MSINNQLRKGAWLQRSFTLSTINRLSYFSLLNSYFLEIRPNEMMSIPSRCFFMSAKEPVLHAVNRM